MYKKSLLGLSVLAAMNSYAATLATGTAVTHTVQGLQTAAVTAATASSYKITLGAEYAAGDTITYTYNVDFSTGFTVPGSFTCNDNVGGNADTVEFGLLSSTANSATYRVTGFVDGSTAAGITTTGLICATPTVTLSPAGLVTAGTATVTFAAQTANGLALDTTAAATKDIAKTVAEYSVTVGGAFNGVVDVNAGKAAFTDGTATSSPDALTFTTVEATGTAGNSVTKSGAANSNDAVGVAALTATTAKSVSTVTGSTGFSFLDTDTTTAGMQLGTNTVADTDGGTAITYSTDLKSIVMTDDATVGANTLTITKVVEATTIPNQTYTGSSVFTWDTSQTTTVPWSAGAWTLNAASVTAYSMPFGDTVTQFLWVTNKGATSGDITASVVHNGVTSGPYSVGTVAGKSSEYIATALSDALAADGVTVTGGRANVLVEVTSPTADIIVSAGYKVTADNDRLPVETSDTILNSVSVSGTVAACTNGDTDATTATDNALTMTAAAATALNAGTAVAAGGISTPMKVNCGLGGGSITTTTVTK